MFNINEFKSVMNKYGGPAKNNLFVVWLSFAREDTTDNRTNISIGGGKKMEYIDHGDLRFFCQEVNVPALNINSSSYRANVVDIPQMIPINLSTPSINTTFMLDSDQRVLSFFHSWFQEIVHYDIGKGYLSQINGDQLPYELGYKSDYTCTMFINHYKTNSNGDFGQYYEYRFFDVFPTEIGNKSLSWAPSDAPATMTVNFTASGFSFTASDPGSPTTSLSRGNGYLDFINSVGFRGQTVQQSDLPRSIQDAINTFTRVRSTFKTLQNIF